MLLKQNLARINIDTWLKFTGSGVLKGSNSKRQFLHGCSGQKYSSFEEDLTFSYPIQVASLFNRIHIIVTSWFFRYGNNHHQRNYVLLNMRTPRLRYAYVFFIQLYTSKLPFASSKRPIAFLAQPKALSTMIILKAVCVFSYFFFRFGLSLFGLLCACACSLLG